MRKEIPMANAIDPVCKMKVDERNPAATTGV